MARPRKTLEDYPALAVEYIEEGLGSYKDFVGLHGSKSDWARIARLLREAGRRSKVPLRGVTKTLDDYPEAWVACAREGSQQAFREKFGTSNGPYRRIRHLLGCRRAKSD